MPGRGQLIALEGSGGRAMARAARRLQRSLRQTGIAAGISSWDASGIFFEIREGARGIPGASPRTLILLYASDLAFRLRWEIRPALEAGTAVVAAPYIETAIAFGRAAGIPRLWLKELFDFAPRPDVRYRASETKLPPSQRPQPADSFLEFSFVQLRNTNGRWNTEDMRRDFLAHLAGLESRGQCRLLTDRLLVSAAAG
jgi:hypothetical protein